MLRRYRKNKNYTRTLIIRIKIVCNKELAKQTKRNRSILRVRTVMTGTRISEQKAFSQRRRLSRVSRRMSWSFPGEYGEKWGTMGNNEQTDRKIERERERERESERERERERLNVCTIC